MFNDGLLFDPIGSYISELDHYKLYSKINVNGNFSSKEHMSTSEKKRMLHRILKHFEESFPDDERKKELLSIGDCNYWESFVDYFIALQDKKFIYNLRFLSDELRTRCNLNSFPVFNFNKIDVNTYPAGLDDVVQVVIGRFPEPDYFNIDWRKLLDFKNDPNTRMRIVAFRRFLNKIAKEKYTYIEICDEIEYLCRRYEEHLSLSKMKYRNGVLSAFLVATAEVICGFCTFNPSMITKGIFYLKNMKLELLESEKDAPGREISYLIKAQELSAK